MASEAGSAERTLRFLKVTTAMVGSPVISRASRAAFLAVSLAACLWANEGLALPGEVLSHQKISDTDGGFTGTIDNSDHFGYSVTSLGDLDGDGPSVHALAVGAHNDDDGGTERGAAWILFLDPNGRVTLHQKISDIEGGFTGTLANGNLFGESVASLGDLGSGDPNVHALAVGAMGDSSAEGAVWILFLNSNGTVNAHQKINDTEGGFTGTLNTLDRFGESVASLGDINGDGVGDLAVAATFDDGEGSDRGAVWILFLNSNGTVDSHQKISDTEGGFTGELNDEDFFGRSLAWLGDFNGEGVAALAVGANGDDAGGDRRGAVWILFLNSNGTVNAHQKISDTEGDFIGPLDDVDQFGGSVASIGDFDGDGIGDLAVGAVGDDDGGSGHGALWLLFLDPNGRVDSHQKISDTEGGFSGTLATDDRFATDLAPMGDLDGDGVGDLAVGAEDDDDGGTDLSSNRGAVWVLFLNGCGNGVLDLGEECDDGNNDNCDGCSSTCQTEVSCQAAEPPCEGGELCNPATGSCDPEPDAALSTPCEADGNLCTDDHCDGNGSCVLLSNVVCQAADPPCEGGELCNPGTGSCDPQADAALSTPCQADGNLCTNDHCDGSGSCVVESTVDCGPPPPPCEGGLQCNPASGLCEDLPDAPLSTSCEADEDLCTDDHCDGNGNCVFLEDTVCDDSDPCTTDSCNMATGCQNVPIPGCPCGNNVLDPGEDCDGTEDLACPGLCQADCMCQQCGNGQCDATETSCSCPTDCGSETCGNGDCCLAVGENTGSCPADCTTICGDGACKCINTMNKNLQKVASKQGKEICTCIKDGAKGKLGSQTIEECLTADNKGKVKKTKDKTRLDAAKKCATDPEDPGFAEFGVTDPNSVNEAAVQKELDLVHAIFGADLDSAIALETEEKTRAKCQQKVFGKVKKCQDTKLKEFNKCKKVALVEGANDPIDLEGCMLVNPQGKIAKACIDKVRAQVQSQCVLKAVNLAGAFPSLGLTDPDELVNELDRIVECLICRALNTADALSRDCDEVDDGMVNGSCP